MKKFTFTPIVLSLIALISCTKETIIGSGVPISEFREVPTFTNVSSEGVFEVSITESDEQSVEITADNNIIHSVKTEVVDNELRLYLDNHNYRNVSLRATIFVQNIYSIKNSGIGNISAFNISNAEQFTISNTGTGNIYVSGGAKNLDLKNEGSGSYYGFDFALQKCNIHIKGSGDCEINSSDNLNVQIEGSGNVYFIGNPTIETNITGSGRIFDSN